MNSRLLAESFAAALTLSACSVYDSSLLTAGTAGQAGSGAAMDPPDAGNNKDGGAGGSPTTDGGGSSNGDERLEGIWYSTWYASEGHYVWVSSFGVGSARQL